MRVQASSVGALVVLVFALLAPTLAHAQTPPPNDQVILTPPPSVPPVDAPQAPQAPPDVTPEPTTEPAKKYPPAGYIPGTGFVMQSEDATFRLRIGMVGAYKFEPVRIAGAWADRNTFFVLRPFLGGNFFRDWIKFWTSFEFAANPPYLLDSYIELTKWQQLWFRIGQMWTPFDRHEYFGPQEILFPEWAPVSEYFWSGRDKGVTTAGTLAEQLDYYIGIFSGTPLRQFNALPGNYMLQARLTWNPLGPTGATEFPYIVSEGPAPFRVSATVQGYYGKIQSAIENFNPSTFTFQTMATGDTRKQAAGNVDLWLQGRYFMAYAEGFVRKTEPPMSAPSYTSIGAWGQAGVPIITKTMDVAVRFNWLDASTNLSNDTFVSAELQFAYYVMHTQNLVVKARYGIAHQDSPGMAALGPVPLIISTPGTAQLWTLQLNLAF